MYLARETFLWNLFSCLSWRAGSKKQGCYDIIQRSCLGDKGERDGGLLVKVLEKNTVCLFLTTKYAKKTLNFVNIHWIGWYTKWGRPFIGVVKYDGVISGGTVTPHASFNFVVAPGRSLITVMLEEVPGVNVRTVYQSDAKPGSGKALSGSGNWPNKSRAGFGKTQNMRDLTTTREARFTKILARDAILGKKTIFGMEMAEVRDAEIPQDCRRKERECGMRTLFQDPEKHGCQKCKGGGGG